MQNETAYNEQLNESAFTLISRKTIILTNMFWFWDNTKLVRTTYLY